MGCIQMNLSKAPFNNAKLRQAMAYATSSEQYVQVIDGGVTEPTNGVFTAGSPYYLTDNGYPAYNLAKAKQLVSEVKSSGGSVAFTLGHTPDPKGSQIGQYLQQVLQSAGMQVTLVPILQDSIINVALTGAYEALTWRQFGAVNPDLNYIFWTPTNASTPGFAINMARNTDPAMQTALLQGRQSTDKATQVAAYQQVNRLLSQDIPYVWYARTVWAIGTQPNVQNFNNPSTPAGGKAFGLIGGAVWPQQIWLS
jgi:ABC-type transport system substrate-binding protein